VPAIIVMLISREEGDEAVFQLLEAHDVDIEDET
jgi:hypothetical protein